MSKRGRKKPNPATPSPPPPDEDEEWFPPPRDPDKAVPWGVREDRGSRGTRRSLSKIELIATIAASTGESQATVDAVLGGLFETLAESVGSGTKVSIPGWLAVERTHRAARTGRNPQTGAKIEIPAGYSVKISVGSKLRRSAEHDNDMRR